MTFFDAAGPFEIEREDGYCTGAQAALWVKAEEHDDGLSRAIGCYLFCVRHGENLKPWYVGKTAATTGFRGEVFQKHKLDIFNEVLGGRDTGSPRRGQPVLFLFPLWTESGRFSRAYSSGGDSIEWLERTLMGMAYAQNDEISNVRDMTRLKSIQVSGLLGPRRPGRPYEVEKQVRRALLGKAD